MKKQLTLIKVAGVVVSLAAAGMASATERTVPTPVETSQQATIDDDNSGYIEQDEWDAFDADTAQKAEDLAKKASELNLGQCENVMGGSGACGTGAFYLPLGTKADEQAKKAAEAAAALEEIQESYLEDPGSFTCTDGIGCFGPNNEVLWEDQIPELPDTFVDLVTQEELDEVEKTATANHYRLNVVEQKVENNATQAQIAINKADTSQVAANNAGKVANGAHNLATINADDITTLKSDVETAQSTADAAQSTADNAQTTADDALEAANAASDKATTINGFLQNAITEQGELVIENSTNIHTNSNAISSLTTADENLSANIVANNDARKADDVKLKELIDALKAQLEAAKLATLNAQTAAAEAQAIIDADQDKKVAAAQKAANDALKYAKTLPGQWESDIMIQAEATATDIANAVKAAKDQAVTFVNEAINAQSNTDSAQDIKISANATAINVNAAAIAQNALDIKQNAADIDALEAVDQALFNYLNVEYVDGEIVKKVSKSAPARNTEGRDSTDRLHKWDAMMWHKVAQAKRLDVPTYFKNRWGQVIDLRGVSHLHMGKFVMNKDYVKATGLNSVWVSGTYN